jgi:uncharacterized protein
MSRPRLDRKIGKIPTIKGMKPYGYYARPRKEIQLYYEEYEVIRLLDYENLTQEDAATAMGVSRPTLTRIYESARKKVARSFIEGSAILIEGGQAVFDNTWHNCPDCNTAFTVSYQKPGEITCPVCTPTDVIELINPQKP